MTTEPDWLKVRTEFPTLTRRNYLCSCSLGLLPNRGRDALTRFADLWTEEGAMAWFSHWLEQTSLLRHEFASTINAQPEEIALLPNISSALAAISSSLDLREGAEIITTELDFPTVPQHFLAKASQGVKTLILPSADKVKVDLDQFEAATTDRTVMVATSRVFFTSGYIQDIAALAGLARRKDCLLLVDDYQGTGQVPIDVKAIGVDILVSGGLKWLLGGPGIAYLYVRGDLIRQLTPTVAGWFGNKDQFDFNPQEMVFREDAARFEAGTPSVPSVYAGAAGLELINELGADNIRRRTVKLTSHLVEQLKQNGFKLRIPEDPEQHASITMVESSDAKGVVERLSKQNIIVDARPGAVRFSPYFYNTEEDIEEAVSVLVKDRSTTFA